MLFKDDATYEHGRRSGVFTRETLARLFRVAPDRVYSIHEYLPARVIKFSMIRDVSSGDFGGRSVFGAQQWAPLIDLEIPEPAGTVA